MSWRAGGIRPWIVQRLSALVMVAVLLTFMATMMLAAPSNFQEWQDFLAGGVWNTVLIIFWLSLFAHAWIGMRDVFMDYIAHDALRFVTLGSFAFFIIAMIIWMFKIMIMAETL